MHKARATQQPGRSEGQATDGAGYQTCLARTNTASTKSGWKREKEGAREREREREREMDGVGVGRVEGEGGGTKMSYQGRRGAVPLLQLPWLQEA